MESHDQNLQRLKRSAGKYGLDIIQGALDDPEPGLRWRVIETFHKHGRPEIVYWCLTLAAVEAYLNGF